MDNNNSADRETTRLWRANKTVHQLVHDRGYVVSQAELELTLPEFVTTFAPTGSVLEYTFCYSFIYLFYLFLFILSVVIH